MDDKVFYLVIFHYRKKTSITFSILWVYTRESITITARLCDWFCCFLPKRKEQFLKTMKPAQRKGGHTSLSAQTAPILIYPARLQLIKHLPQWFPPQIYLPQYTALTGCCRLLPNLQPFPGTSSSGWFGHVARDDAVFPLTPRCCLWWDRSLGSQSTTSVQPCPLQNDFRAVVLPATAHTGYFSTCVSCWLTQKLLFKNGWVHTSKEKALWH